MGRAYWFLALSALGPGRTLAARGADINRWPRSGIWVLAGTAMVVASFAVPILTDSEPLAIATFWLGLPEGVAVGVRCVLMLIERLERRAARTLALATIAGMVQAVVLHNVVDAVTGVEEAFSFIAALWVGPCLLVAAVIRWFRPASGGKSVRGRREGCRGTALFSLG